MSYILYSSIARAGGIDQLLSTASFSEDLARQAQLRRRRAIRQARVESLRRRTGLGLLALGGTLTRWGRHLAPTPRSTTPGPLKLVAE